MLLSPFDQIFIRFSIRRSNRWHQNTVIIAKSFHQSQRLWPKFIQKGLFFFIEVDECFWVQSGSLVKPSGSFENFINAIKEEQIRQHRFDTNVCYGGDLFEEVIVNSYVAVGDGRLIHQNTNVVILYLLLAQFLTH